MTCDWCNEEKEEVESIKINNKWRDICRECLEHGVKIEVVSAQDKEFDMNDGRWNMLAGAIVE